MKHSMNFNEWRAKFEHIWKMIWQNFNIRIYMMNGQNLDIMYMWIMIRQIGTCEWWLDKIWICMNADRTKLGYVWMLIEQN